jgi:hypothetical protein
MDSNDLRAGILSALSLPNEKLNRTASIKIPVSSEKDKIVCAFCGEDITTKLSDDPESRYLFLCSCQESQNNLARYQDIFPKLAELQKELKDLETHAQESALNVYIKKYRDFVKVRNKELKERDEMVEHLNQMDEFGLINEAAKPKERKD